MLIPRLLLLSLLTLACLPTSRAALDEIVVTASRTAQPLSDTAAAITAIGSETLEMIQHRHISETLQRVPGVWISRGNGQEHLTAIRSPVLTGAGSCGAFVMAQDGVSLRAPGFCNVNELFEAASEIAERIEVVRGPGSSLYGTNALHGIINVITPEPDAGLRRVSLGGGPDDYYRLTASASTDMLRAEVSAATDGGYKQASGFDQQKLMLKHQTQANSRQVTTTFAYTNLNQETAGFVTGFRAFEDSERQRVNPNPEAYRDARSYRLLSTIEQQTSDGVLILRPYLRHVDMTFLQHFLPGQAIEENGHSSAGVMALWQPDSTWRVGAELDYTQGFLRENQPGTITGNAFLAATIPPGQHYDYDVEARMAGLFADVTLPVTDKLRIDLGARLQYTHYDYDNQMLDGTTRDDGTACGFGGCRFSRPADRQDTFTNLSPKASFIYSTSDEHQIYGSLATGFRAPQATELYRLQGGQDVANIDPVELTSVELGVRGRFAALDYRISAYAMDKDNVIFRNTDRQNLDNGQTSHQGIELDLARALTPTLQARLAFTFADHAYENNPTLVNSPIAGNTIDTAPQTLGSATLGWQPTTAHSLELEWVHIGEYFLDPQNNHEYQGHDLLHLRGQWQLSDATSLSWRLMNLTDEDYADRADFGFGQYRYFIGTPRSLYVGLTVNL